MSDPLPSWPALPLADWVDTRDTLQLWTQIVGKVRLALAPPLNHWWNVPLYVNSVGLTTSLMPYGGLGLEITFDLSEHQLVIASTTGQRRRMVLEPRSVADFYTELTRHLADLGWLSSCTTSPSSCRWPSRSTPTRSTPAMTRRLRTTSGCPWCMRTGCCRGSVAGFGARRARCTSSGARSTWPSPASRADPQRRTQVASPTVPTG